jgi:hypothetical protein
VEGKKGAGFYRMTRWLTRIRAQSREHSQPPRRRTTMEITTIRLYPQRVTFCQKHKEPDDLPRALHIQCSYHGITILYRRHHGTSSHGLTEVKSNEYHSTSTYSDARSCLPMCSSRQAAPITALTNIKGDDRFTCTA